MTIFAYARVSTSDQTVQPQLDVLSPLTAHIFTDEAVSGIVHGRDRPGFSALLSQVQPGDTIVVVRLDRLGRSVVDVLEQVESLTKKGITVRSLAEGVDSSTPAGRMVLGVMASLAAYERELTKERQKAGIASAKAAGKHLGRPESLTLDQKTYAVQLRNEGKSPREIARLLGSSATTIRRIMTLAE